MGSEPVGSQIASRNRHTMVDLGEIPGLEGREPLAQLFAVGVSHGLVSPSVVVLGQG